MGYKISTYRGPRTKFRTMVVVSNQEPCGSKNYRETHIWMNEGQLYYIVTDGYKYLGIDRPIRNNLKSAINIVIGNMEVEQYNNKGV